MKHMALEPEDASRLKVPGEEEDLKPLNIGIVGFGSFGQILARRLSLKHRVSTMDYEDRVS